MFSKKDNQCYEFASNKKLIDTYEELKNQSFEYAHNSYIVNMAYIKSYRGNEIYLTNNKVVWVSKSRRKEFLKSLSDYYENYLNV